MEEKIIEEQPAAEPAEALDKADESVESAAGSSNENGNLGKFKTPEALYQAYKALEAEFTRKSQRLSELEKDKTEKATVDEKRVDDELSSFLSKRSEASPYADKLKSKSLQEGGRVDFEEMLAAILLENLETGSSKFDNPIITKYVFQDEELKNHVIENYMKELKTGMPPFVISGDKGEKVTGQKPATPASLAEAKKIVEDMFS